MRGPRRPVIPLFLALLPILPSACSPLHPAETVLLSSLPAPSVDCRNPASSSEPSSLRLTSSELPSVEEAPGPGPVTACLAGMDELSVDLLIPQVLARTPTLAQMVA